MLWEETGWRTAAPPMLRRNIIVRRTILARNKIIQSRPNPDKIARLCERGMRKKEKARAPLAQRAKFREETPVTRQDEERTSS